jgi:hypothetical protein
VILKQGVDCLQLQSGFSRLQRGSYQFSIRSQINCRPHLLTEFVFRCNCTSIPFHRQHIALALAAVKQIELEEQRQWLAQATQRMAAVALQIDEGLHRLARQEEIKEDEKWWAELAIKEQKQNEEILAAY